VGGRGNEHRKEMEGEGGERAEGEKEGEEM